MKKNDKSTMFDEVETMVFMQIAAHRLRSCFSEGICMTEKIKLIFFHNAKFLTNIYTTLWPSILII